MIPTNEQGVVALFSKLSHELGYEFKRIGNHCPDAVLEKDGHEVRVEFEYRSSNFQAHRHDPKLVDLIVCWQDDWAIPTVPVLSLQMYLTLIGHRQPKVSPWRQFLDWCQSFRLAYIEHHAAIKVAQLKAMTCPQCGAGVRVKCNYTDVYSQDHYWIGLYKRWGIAFTICSECGYTQGEVVNYPSHWECSK